MLLDKSSSCSTARIFTILGTVLFVFFTLLAGQYRSVVPNMTRAPSSLTRNNAQELRAFFLRQLALRINATFLPTFHNHRLSITLNLTSTSISQLHLSLLNASSTDKQSLCEITLIFQPPLPLTNVSHNTTCSLSFSANSAKTITLTLHRRFASHDTFRFESRSSHRPQHTETLSWPRWPLPSHCLHPPSNDMACSHQTTLSHTSAFQSFVAEQHALSDWLDLLASSNNRNRAPFERANDPSICSAQFQTWIADYRRWHENITSILGNINNMTIEQQRDRLVDLNVRFLIYEKHHSGIADRVAHLISTYMVALLTKRLFIFDSAWPDFADMMQPSLNYEHDLIAHWLQHLDKLNKNLDNNDRRFLSSKTHWFSFDRFSRDYDYDKAFPERFLTFRAHTGGVVHTIHSNGSVYRKFLIEDLHMNASTLFGCLYHSLFTYKVSELIQMVALTAKKDALGHSSEEMLRALLSPRLFSIGVQIRTGDQHMRQSNPSPSPASAEDPPVFGLVQHYFQCAQDMIINDGPLLERTKQAPFVLLISDSYEVRRAALRRWSLSSRCLTSPPQNCQQSTTALQIMSSSSPVLHITFAADRTLAFRLGMLDMFLFSLCDQQLISIESGFGRIPAFASLKLTNIHGVLLNEQKPCAKEGMAHSIAGYHWSGI